MRTNFPHRHKGGIPPMPRGERLRRTPERQSQAPATVLHVRGVCSQLHRGGGDRGVCLIYVACPRAVHGVGTLCLLAGIEQVEFVNKVRAKHEQFPALAPAHAAKCHSFSIGKPLAYLLKGRMAGKGVTSFDRPGLWYKRKPSARLLCGAMTATGVDKR